MAARKRSKAPTSARRLVALLLLNLAALALLWRAVGGPEQVGASEQPPGSAPTLVAPGLSQEAAPVDASPRSSRPLARPSTGQALRSLVDTYIGKAVKSGRGKLDRGNVRVAVHVRELGQPDCQLALNADRAQMPASNMKLVTTAAALVLLGPGWHFTTPAEAGGPVRDGVLEGDLVVRAAGDPLYAADAHGSVDALLAPWITQLSASGLRRIRGDLVLDEGSFEVPQAPPGWPAEGQRWAEYCALAGGFSANRGCLTATVSAARPGQAARVQVEPRHHGLPENIGVETVAKGQLIVRLDGRGPSGVTVRGSVPSSVSSWSDAFAHPDPVELFGNVFAGALRDAGVQLDGRVRRERAAPGGPELGSLRTPLAQVLGPINTDSNNGVADQLFLALGNARAGSGTRAAAAKVTAEALEHLGVPSAGFEQVDGSGLARGNRVSARQMTALIAAVLELSGPAPALFRASLAVGGRTGTLADRMEDAAVVGRVHAKTGFIGGVSALSGVVESASGPHYAFSILVEYPAVDGLNSRYWKPMQDDIVGLLAELGP